MVSGILEALGVQLGCQAIWPLINKLYKLISRMAKAYPEAKEFRKIFNRQYKTLKATATSIISRYDLKNTRCTWSKSVNDIAAKAEGIFWELIEKIKAVLWKDGYTWRIRWGIVHKRCKKASVQMGQLNDELLRIETAVRLEYENEQKKKVEQTARKKKAEEAERERHKTAMKTGTAVGGGLGLVGGAAVGYLCVEATLKGAAVGGLAGAIVGAVIGFGYCWYWR